MSKIFIAIHKWPPFLFPQKHILYKKISPQAKAHGEINEMIKIAIHLTVFLKRQCRFRL